MAQALSREVAEGFVYPPFAPQPEHIKRTSVLLTDQLTRSVVLEVFSSDLIVGANWGKTHNPWLTDVTSIDSTGGTKEITSAIQNKALRCLSAIRCTYCTLNLCLCSLELVIGRYCSLSYNLTQSPITALMHLRLASKVTWLSNETLSGLPCLSGRMDPLRDVRDDSAVRISL